MGAPKQPAFACMYVILKKKLKKKPFVKKNYKILFCAAKPTTTTRTTKETKQKQKGETCLHISLYRNESDIYKYIYILYIECGHISRPAKIVINKLRIECSTRFDF